jgi:hypothetical protein
LTVKNGPLKSRILHMTVDPLPTAHSSGEMWANIGHPVSPDKLAWRWARLEIRSVVMA